MNHTKSGEYDTDNLHLSWDTPKSSHEMNYQKKHGLKNPSSLG